MQFVEFTTSTPRFPRWEEKVYWVAAWLSGGAGVVLIFRWLGRADLPGWAFWAAFTLSAALFAVTVAAVAMGLFVYLGLNVAWFGDIELRGRTRAEPDGSIVVESTRDGSELARCVPGCRKSIVVGIGRFEQLARCEKFPESSVPITACLFCAETVAGGSEWVHLFAMTHDRQDVVVSVNGEDIRFPYHGHPNYTKIARRVAQAYPAFAHLAVRDASAK